RSTPPGRFCSPPARGRSTPRWPVLVAAPSAARARTASPTAFRYALAVSRRTPVVSSMRRRDRPSRPSAITCPRFSTLKTLATAASAEPPPLSTSRRRRSGGRFSAVDHWPVLGVDRGHVSLTQTLSAPYQRGNSQRLENIRSAHTQIESVGSEDQDVRVYGDTAVITGRVTLKGKYSGKEASGLYRSISVWVNQRGRWRLVANQITLIAKH